MHAPLKPHGHVGLRTKLFYGSGSIAYGVKDNGFQTFLLLFYNQVVGLPAQTVGLAIMIALVIDALIDPVVGEVSDRWRSRWGRRHPFMYAAALPAAASYLILWHPPQMSPEGLFLFLLVTIIVVRTFITLYEIPSAALAPELTEDYDERTSIVSYRYLFGWVGGLGMTVLAYAVFLRPTPAYPVGQLNPVGYQHYGTVAAVVMFVAILVSALGTHKHIPLLRQPEPAPRRTTAQMLKEMLATLSHRSFVMVALGGVFGSMVAGLASALSIYLATYYWRLSSEQISAMLLANFAGVVAATIIAPRVSRWLGKRTGVLIAMPLALCAAFSTYALRYLGVMPPDGSTPLLFCLMAFAVVATTLNVTCSVLIASMITDVVDDSELTTGRRSEGLFFSALSLIQKSVSGAGVFLSGVILTSVKFPAHAVPGKVDPSILNGLLLTYLACATALALTALACFGGYRIDRRGHEETLRRLEAIRLGREAS